jgi:D-alanine-D-alanine ligase
MRVGITYDLEDDYLAAGFTKEEAAEFDSIETIDAIDGALRAIGCDTDRIGNIKQLVPRLSQGDRWDLVFNIAEGCYGFSRESQVPALLDAYKIPYTFSEPIILGITLNKGITQKLIRASGIPAARFGVVEEVGDIKKIDLPFPLFAKPIAEGTGKGVTARSKISSRAELIAVCKDLLKSYAQPVLVEEFLPGREFTVGILGTGSKAHAVGVMEVHLSPQAEQQVYGYHNKTNWKELVSYSLARGAIARECKTIALAAWRELGCSDCGRIDLRLNSEGTPCFLEVNPLPGIRPGYSDFCILNDFIKLEYSEFIRRIVDSACERAHITPPWNIREDAQIEERRYSA